MSFTLTEHSLRQPLLTELQSRLSDAGYTALNELAFSAGGASRRIPDIVILRNGKFHVRGEVVTVEPGGIGAIIETKKLAIASGMAQAAQYQAIIRKYFGPARVVASTDFRRLWMLDEGSGNYTLEPKPDEKSIAEAILSAIRSGIGRPPRVYTEADYVLFLQAAVDQLTGFTSQINPGVAEQLTGIFFAKTLDPEIGKDTRIAAEVSATSQKAAAFVLVNQLFFYQILSSGASAGFLPLQSPVSLREVQKAFNSVLRKDFSSIYSAKIVELLSPEAEEAVNGVIEQLRILRVESLSSDIIGKVFHSLIPFHLRKRIAAYYTGNPAARLLSLLCVKSGDDRVADLACGSGTMLVEAYRRIDELKGATGGSDCERHNEILGQIYGTDICLFPGQLAAMNLFIQNLSCFPKLIGIGIEDAFHLVSSKQSILPVQDAVRTDFVVTQGRLKFPKSFQAILINPPFTDRRRMLRTYVDAIDEVVEGEHKDGYVTGQFHLGGYFILHCESFLAPGGYLGVVIPESILANTHLNGLRRFLRERFRILAIISSSAQVAFSHDSDWKEVLLILRKGSPNAADQTCLVTLRELLDYGLATEVANYIEAGRVPEGATDRVSLKRVASSELKETGNWLRLIRADPVLEELEERAHDKLKPGGSVFGGFS